MADRYSFRYLYEKKNVYGGRGEKGASLKVETKTQTRGFALKIFCKVKVCSLWLWVQIPASPKTRWNGPLDEDKHEHDKASQMFNTVFTEILVV